MADMEYESYETGDGEAAPERSSMAAAIFNWAGALISIALVVGLSVWGYRLTLRDAGEVPVVRALQGPMREAPEDPGGVDAAHQGLAVNSVQAEGGVDGPVDQVTLAPSPVELAEEDLPRAALRPPARTEALAEGGEIPEDLAEAAPEPGEDHPDPGPLALSPEDEAIMAAVAEAEAEAEAEAAGVVPALAGADDPDARIIPASLPGVSLSPRPRPRPEIDVAALRNATAISGLASAEPVDIDPAELPSGTRLVQLGAFDDETTARAEWDRMAAAHDDLLEDKRRVIQEAESGGRRFVRLRAAGFEGMADARGFCSAMLARGADCIPVTTR